MKIDKKIAELEAENALLKNEIAKLKILNDWYLEQLRLARYRRFGASSEKTELPNQLGLFNEVEVLSDLEESEQQQIVTQTRKKRKGKREAFYKDLPTEQVIHEIPENERVCPECGGLFHACGYELLRCEVKVIPAQIYAVEHV